LDKLGIAALQSELQADCQVLADAVALARSRFGSATPPELDACAFQLTRSYNVVEQIGLRIAKAFENHIDDERGWHTELIRRLTLNIPGVRPAFLPIDLAQDLRDLRNFRHVIVHAYDLTLQAERLLPILLSAERIAARMSTLCDTFFNQLQS
jgi:hypothetical protein